MHFSKTLFLTQSSGLHIQVCKVSIKPYNYWDPANYLAPTTIVGGSPIALSDNYM